MFASAEKISTKEVKQNMGTQNEVFDAEVMGEQLKKLRKKVKLSQEKFAERMGMSKDTIYNYEKGKTAIPHDLIKRLCQEFNVSADYFYFETDKPLVEDALYCKDASKKVRAAKAVLAKQGKYIASFAPFGYKKSEDDKHVLAPDPVTAPVVQLIFELAIKGMKYTEIANYLNDNGYDSIFEYYQKIGVKRCYERDIGEHMWSASTVMEILYNEVYIGSVINNKTADNIDTGHQVVQRDKEDWIIVENCHEPLVSVEDFKLAHKMIARREVTKRKPNGKWRKSYIRCGVCGKGLYKYGNKSSYRCHNGHVSRIRGEELKSALLDIARNMALAQLQEFELKTDGGNCPDNLEREIESLKKSKAHYAKLKFEIYDDYTSTLMTPHTLHSFSVEW